MNNQLCHIDHSLLMLIDLQTKLMNTMPEEATNTMRHNVLTLIQASQQLNIPIIPTIQYPQGLGGIDDAIQQALSDEITIFEKTSFSCLGADGLAVHLAQQAKKQIILMGIEAHICILQSAYELAQSGHHVWVLYDGIASRHQTNYDNAIQRLQSIDNITISNTESVLFEWLKDARHPHFKTLSRLIV